MIRHSTFRVHCLATRELISAAQQPDSLDAVHANPSLRKKLLSAQVLCCPGIYVTVATCWAASIIGACAGVWMEHWPNRLATRELISAAQQPDSLDAVHANPSLRKKLLSAQVLCCPGIYVTVATCWAASIIGACAGVWMEHWPNRKNSLKAKKCFQRLTPFWGSNFGLQNGKPEKMKA